MTVKQFLDFGWNDSHAGYALGVDTLNLTGKFGFEYVSNYIVTNNGDILLDVDDQSLPFTTTPYEIIQLIERSGEDILDKQILIEYDYKVYSVTNDILVNGIDEKVKIFAVKD